MAFSFYGPTCDDLDHMTGPFLLPADVAAGDYIEIGMLGAYGCAMRTGFNGFGSDLKASSRTSRWRASTESRPRSRQKQRG
jgi:ornithine decarboxylase